MESWRKLHDDTDIVDLHSHPGLKVALFGRNLAAKKLKPLAKVFTSGFWPMSVRTNFHKVEDSGLATQLATVYVPEEGWFQDFNILRALRFLSPSVKKYLKQSYFDATIQSITMLEEQVSAYNSERRRYNQTVRPKKLVIARNPQALLAARERNEIALVHSVEGAHSLQGECWDKLSIPQKDTEVTTVMQSEVFMNLETLQQKGVAYLTLAHFYPNCCVQSPCFPYPGYSFTFIKKKGLFDKWDHNKGLSKLGEQVVEKMLELGILIDITHLTPVARKRVYEIVDHHKKDNAVIASHVGAYAINPDPYCLQDWELRWLAGRQCVAGVIFMNYWLSPVDTPLGLKYVIETMRHMANVAGHGVVSLGTDFDGFTDPPDEVKDMSELFRITRELTSLQSPTGRLFTDDQVAAILGGNATRVLLGGWAGVK